MTHLLGSALGFLAADVGPLSPSQRPRSPGGRPVFSARGATPLRWGAFRWNAPAIWRLPAPSHEREANADRLFVSLNGARLLASSLTTDLSWVFRRKGAKWKVEAEIFDVALECDDLKSWLLGRAAASGAGRLDIAVRVGRVVVALRGDADIRLFPDGRIEADGAGICHVTGLGEPLLADRLRLWPAAKKEPSLFERPATMRWRAVIDAGGQRWPEIEMPIAGIGQLRHAAGGNGLLLEADEERLGRPRLAVAVLGGAGGDLVCETLHAAGGGPLQLPVAVATAAQGFASGQHEVVADCDLAGGAVWARRGTSAIRLRTDGARLQSAHGSTSLSLGFDELALPFDGIASTLRFANAPAVSFERARGGANFRIEGQLQDPIFHVIREEDFVALEFELRNYYLDDADTPATFRRKDKSKPGTVIVRFGPQSIGEQAFNENGPYQLPARARLSSRSELVFQTRKNELPFELAALLDWSELTMVPPAIRSSRRGVKMVTTEEPYTRLEVPYRLATAPTASRFVHDRTPKRLGTTAAEVWRTQLQGTGGGMPQLFVLEALKDPPGGFDTGLTSSDRENIAKRAAGAPLPTQRLALSALGAHFSMKAAWEPIPGSDLASWRHTLAQGREHLARATYHGFLLPFGHRASLVRLAERKLRQVTVNGHTSTHAVLERRYFLEINQRTVDFSAPTLFFKRVEIDLSETPSLSNSGDPKVPFWPNVGAQLFLFPVTMVDRRGSRISFRTPLYWIPFSLGTDASVASKFNDAAEDVRRPTLEGQSVAFADPAGNDDTVLATYRVEWKVQRRPPSDGLAYSPVVAKAEVEVPALQHWLGARALGAPSAATRGVPDHRGWIEPLDPQQFNEEVYARVLEGVAVDLASYGADRAGGFAMPSFNVRSLSRRLGPLNVPAGAQPHVQLGDLFSSEAKLLGLPLSKLLGRGNFKDDGPSIKTRFDVTTGALHVSYRWSTDKLTSFPPFVPAQGATLAIEVEITVKPGSAGGVERSAAAALLPAPGAESAFAIEFPKLARLTFASFRFVSRTGAKTEVRPALRKVEFLGALSFMEDLAKILKIGGEGNGFSLAISPMGVEANLGIRLTPITVGALSLVDLAFSARLAVPFLPRLWGDSSPRLRIAVAERHRPFLLTVSIFGGGGYFGIEFAKRDGHGFAVVALECALEFGVAAAVDLVVAAGRIYILAGVYFWRQENDSEAGGYIRAGGSLRIIGLITVSVEFTIGLSYRFAEKLFIGSARLRVEVEFLFFSASVSFTVTRTFSRGGAGSRGLLSMAGSPPSFPDLMGPEHWREYWNAFGYRGDHV